MKLYLNLHKLHPYGDGEVIDENENLIYSFEGNEIKYLGVGNRRIMKIYNPTGKHIATLIGTMGKFIEALGNKAVLHYKNPIFQLNDTKKLMATLEKRKGLLNPIFVLDYKDWSINASGF